MITYSKPSGAKSINIVAVTRELISLILRLSDTAKKQALHDINGRRENDSENTGKIGGNIGAQLIRRVMNFAKPTEPRFDRIHINDPVREAVKLTRVTLKKKGIEIFEDLSDNLPDCFAEPHLVEELVLNLINNASDALSGTREKKMIKVTSTCQNHRIRLAVEDNGPGIDQNLKQKIFDPFFTTKKHSTGIGLSLCHRIVTCHRSPGRIDGQ